MKRCLKCSRVYADEALNFCLDDGEWLVGEGAQSDAPPPLSQAIAERANSPPVK